MHCSDPPHAKEEVTMRLLEPSTGLPADKVYQLIHGDCLQILPTMEKETMDVVFADPPYMLSNGGSTCKNGKRVIVNKGKWDESKGIEADHKFHMAWLSQCQRVLKPDGTIWVSA